MSIDDIRNAIKVTNDTLTVTPTTFQQPGGVAWLLGEYFPDSKFVMQPAALLSGPNDDFVLVKGVVRLLGVDIYDAEVHFTWTGSSAAMAVNGALPTSWRFADCFASLAGSYLNDFHLTAPTFGLTSEPAGGRDRGLALTAGYEPPVFWDLLTWFAVTNKDASLGGLILLDGGQPVMTLTVAPDIQANLGGYLDITLKLQHLVRAYPLPKDHSKRGISVISQLVGAIGFMHAGKQIEVPLAALFSKDPTVLKLQLNTAAVFDLGLSEIAHWFHGMDLQTQALPEFYRPPLGFTLHDVVFAVGLRTRTLEYVSLSIRSTTPWVIIAKALEIAEVAVDIMVLHPAKNPDALVTITGKGTFAGVTLEVYAQVPDFQIEGRLAEGSAVDLSPLIHHYLGAGHGVPETLKISELQFSAYPAGNSYSFSISAEGSWQIINGLELDGIKVAITYEGADEAAAVGVEIHAALLIAGVPVIVSALKIGQADAGWLFTGIAGTEQGIPIGKLSDVVADIASKLGLKDFPAVPAELDVTLQSLSVSFDAGKKEMVLVAETENESTGVVVVSATGETNVGVVIDIHVGLGVSSLPLVGETIAKIEDIGIDSLQLIITSGEFAAREINQLNQIIAMSGKTIKLPDPPDPKGKLPEGVQAGVTYSIDKKPVLPALTFQLTGGTKKAENQPRRVNQLPPADTERTAPAGQLTLGDAANAPTPPPEAWLDIQRSFGPVNIKRIGIGYSSPNAMLMLDAALILSGMTLEMEGLSLQFPFMGPYDLSHISANLHGMSLTYQSGPLDISGGFLNVIPPPTDLKYEYNGELRIQAEGFGLAAIGSFAEFTPAKGGGKSLFLFGVLNATLGGPAFFVVTGIAAGFGYNRSLTLPTLDTLPGFPLVAAAMPTLANPSPFSGDKATDPAQAMTVMNNWVHPSSGQNWVAAGIKFTSFKILESFALLTVAFGTRFEIALLGLSNITMPPLAPDPVGYAQLALEVTYAPDDGVLKVAAQLTPESYILAKACRLTGGFALYTWFKAQDDVHAGDFVVSLGGYNPYFNKPAGYPTVPRVGVNWQVSDQLTIKGGFYFALTPVAVMAGGDLEANFESGNFKAWFIAKVDFLLYWEPFHYQANLSLSLGASYTLGWWTITVHLGVDVSLHGPEFGGTMVVDLYLFSVTISFGPEAKVKPVDWQTFTEHFLPPVQSGAPKATALVTAGEATPSYCFLRVAGGLIKELPRDPGPDAPDWIVNAEQFEIVTASTVPCSAFAHNLKWGQAEPQCASGKFGVKPVGIQNGGLQSIHTVTWTRLKEGGDVIWEGTAVNGRLPGAAWDKESNGAGELGLPSMEDVNGERLTDELTTGLKLIPIGPKPKNTRPVSVTTLEAGKPLQKESQWPGSKFPDSDTFDQKTAWDRLQQIDEFITMRKGIATALRQQNIIVAEETDTRNLKRAAKGHELLAPPVLRHLGEMTPWEVD